ncbi:hypothetical protein FRC07_003049 [Ceratobasidium sp. 392]|nr:hypothetical protein FRC07_003049 [Ceratobasidium sp. 392]
MTTHNQHNTQVLKEAIKNQVVLKGFALRDFIKKFDRKKPPTRNGKPFKFKQRGSQWIRRCQDKGLLCW